jgi:hypothetical protein
LDRCRNGDDERIRWLRFGKGFEASASDSRVDKTVQIRLAEMSMCGIDGGYRFLARIDAENLNATAGYGRGSRQPYVA